MALTTARIYKAGFLHGYLSSHKHQWLNILGQTDVANMVAEKNVFDKFALEHPALVAEYNETVRLMSSLKRKRRKSRKALARHTRPK
jgi:hypothetical protein